MTSRSYHFGPFLLDTRTRSLERDGALVALGPLVVETLRVLVEHAGEVVTKDELMERLWPDRCVEESNLTQNVYRLRRVLAAGGLEGAIETLPCRGYRFAAVVASHERQPAPSALGTPPAGRSSWRRAVTTAACAALALMLLASGAGQQSPASAFTRLSRESQRAYTLGRYHWNLRSDPAHVEASLRYFRAVADRDPNNPLGYSGLADAELARFDGACESKVTACPGIVALASTFAHRAVAADPRSAEAHTSLAMTIYEFTQNDAGAEAEFRRAIELDPAYALAHHWYGNALLVRGRFAQATVQHRTALALEPTSPATYAWLAHDAFFSRRYRDAIAYARESLAIYPGRHATIVLLGLAYERTGDVPSALAAFDRLRGAERRALIAAVHARAGRRGAALAALRTLGPSEAAAAGCAPTVAFAWLALGDRDRAYALLRATPPSNRVERRFLAFDPRFDDLRSDPRFAPWTRPREPPTRGG